MIKIKEVFEKERILCSAIWIKDFETESAQVKNIDKGLVLFGHRHSDIIKQFNSLFGKPIKNFGDSVQGFLTSHNRFVDREEAGEIYESWGYSLCWGKKLYSEDLY